MKNTKKLHREHMRKWRIENPERAKATRQKQYLIRKIMAMNLVGGAICSNCNCDELKFLEFNHINGGGSRESKINKYSIADRLLSKQTNPNKINVLCRVCNALDFLKRKNEFMAQKFRVVWIN